MIAEVKGSKTFDPIIAGEKASNRGKMTFPGYAGQPIFSNPEAVARAGISVYSGVLVHHFGPDAARRYHEAASGTMTFRPGTPGSQDIVVRSPEELANSGIHIHTDAIEQHWGPGAIKRYREAMAAKEQQVQ